MSEERGGLSRWLIGAVIIAIAIVLLWFFTPFGMFIAISIQMTKIHRQEQKMQRPEFYVPLATNLALYCQSVDELQLTNTIGASRLPQPLPRLGSPWGMFYTNYAHIEFGGGSYHYGYRIKLDEEASNSRRNVWELYFHRDNPPDKLLHRVAITPTARVPLGMFVSNSIAEYDRRLAKEPTDLHLHRAKIAFLLEHSRPQVRPACIEAVQALPNHWWPRMTLALVDSGKGKFAEASNDFRSFTEAHPGFSRYLYLAYFYQLTGKPHESAQAIEKAITFPIKDLDDDENNSECRGYTMGVYAFRNREFAAVVKLCDALLPVKENGGYAKSALRTLKSAAEAALAGNNPEFSPSEDVIGFNPYEKIDAQALLTP